MLIITPPLRGSRRSRAARRRLMRWGVDAGPRLPKKKSTKGAKNHEGAPRALALLAVLLILTHGTWRLPPSGSTGRRVCPPPARRDVAFAPHRLDGTRRLPPSGSTAGSALSPTPPQGGSDQELRKPGRLPLKGGVMSDDDFLGARASRPHKAGTALPISPTSINRERHRSRFTM